MSTTAKSITDRRLRFFDALRSGAYPQGQGQLHIRDADTGTWQHCCLGVACLVAIEDGLNLPFREEYRTRYYTTSGLPDDNEGFHECGQLPRTVAEWYGWDEQDPILHVQADGTTRDISAAGANDIWKMTFVQIADAFENTYLLEDQ